MLSLLLLLTAQTALPLSETISQQLVRRMVGAINATPPPGVSSATAGPGMVILNVKPLAEVDPATYAEIFQRNSIGIICSDPGMRKAADVHHITFRISIEAYPRSGAVTRDINSASCASLAAPLLPSQQAGSTVTSPIRPMTGDELETLARRVRAFKPRDQFEAPPKLESVNGKRFSYVVTPLETGLGNVICSGYPSWGYWPQDSRLEVSAFLATGMESDFKGKTGGRLFPSANGYDPYRELLTFSSLKCQKTRLESYTATNGFGAQVEVFKTKEFVTSIAAFEIPETKWKTYWTHQVSGDEARQLSQNVRVRMSGTLKDWAPGKPVLCGKKNSSPDTRRPFDDATEVCVFNGRPDRFEVLDARNNAVLYSSSR